MDLKIVKLFNQWPELSRARTVSKGNSLYIYCETLTIIFGRYNSESSVDFFCYRFGDQFIGNFYFPVWKPELDLSIKIEWHSMQQNALNITDANKALIKSILFEFCNIDIVEEEAQ